MTDLSEYSKRISVPGDRPIFDEAVNCAKADARRAAYVMIWISCAESLKRRFREAQKRDGAAGKVVGEFEQKEKDQKSVDKFLLDKAKEYGFLSDSAHTILLNIYELRCLYGHPYEEAPSDEQVIHAAAMVVDHVLSKPVRLRHGFGKSLLKSLLEDKHFLDDNMSAVDTFAREILPKIDEGIFDWLLDGYWAELEKMADDASLKVYFTRGLWFTRTALSVIGLDIFSHEQWHEKTSRYPKTLVRVLGRKRLYESIGERAQDYLVGSALEQSHEKPSVLQYLDHLDNEEALSERQKSRYAIHIDKMDIEKLRTAGISLKTCYSRVISGLKSHNWYVQKPSVEIVVINGAAEIESLDTHQQELLGRNVLQSADGSEKASKKFLVSISEKPGDFPAAFIRGIVLECFVDDDHQIRLKHEQISKVLTILDGTDETTRKTVLEQLVDTIQEGKPKESYVSKKDFSSVVERLDSYSWGLDLASALRTRQTELIYRSDDDE